MEKLDPYKFTNGEKPLKSLRPGLSGVYHKNGYKQASSGFVYVRLKESYPKQYEGKVVYKDGQIIKADPPKYDRVMPDMNNYSAYRVDVGHLESVRKQQAEKTRKDPEGLKHNIILSEKKSGAEVMLDPLLLKRIVEFMQAKKTDTIYLHKKGSDRYAAVVLSGEEMALIMPLLIDYSVNESELKRRTAVVPLTSKQIPDTGAYKQNRAAKVNKTKNKPKKTSVTMKRTTKKTSSRASSTSKKASRILKEQKKEYQAIFRSEVKKSKSPQAGAKKAGRIYRDRYGATPKARWRNALNKAK